MKRSLAVAFLLLGACCAPLAGQPVPPSPFGAAYLVGDFAPGFPGSEIEHDCVVAGGAGGEERLLFITGIDRQLWTTDGTPGGTSELLPAGESAVHFLRCDGDDAFFRGSPTGLGTTAVWWTDGTAAGTTPLVDLLSPAVSEALPGGLHLLTGHSWSAGGLSETATLWATDRTPGGTVEIPLPGGAGGPLEPGQLVRAGDRVLVAATRLPVGQGTGTGLWASDGTAAGTERLSDLGPGTAWILDMHRLGDEAVLLVRRGADPFQGELELWTSDGSAAGTREVAVDLSERQPFPGRVWRLSTPAGERLVFILELRTGDEDLQQLWVTDGTAAGTVRLLEVEVVQGGPPIGEPVRFGGRFYFDGHDAAHGRELWETDLTPAGTRIALDLCPGPCSSSARLVAPYGERALLRATLPGVGDELWVSDLTPSGSRLVGDLCPGPCSSRPHHVTQPAGAAGWTLFAARPFSVFEGREQLWRLPPPDPDRSPLAWPPPPRRATDFPESDRFHARQPVGPVTALGRSVLFVHGTDDLGRELWSLPFADPPPPPPPGDPVESPAVPGFRLHARITAGPASPAVLGTLEAECIPETACFSGALPGRTEVFVRVVGPKPNGFLWPTLVKLTTSTVEVWIERIETGETRYYVLPGARPGFDELPGLFDRTGFRF
jgi:ELWxxDGT repeat protein